MNIAKTVKDPLRFFNHKYPTPGLADLFVKFQKR
jgi:hypothetical protein